MVEEAVRSPLLSIDETLRLYQIMGKCPFLSNPNLNEIPVRANIPKPDTSSSCVLETEQAYNVTSYILPFVLVFIFYYVFFT